TSPLCPYTTLFRSCSAARLVHLDRNFSGRYISGSGRSAGGREQSGGPSLPVPAQQVESTAQMRAVGIALGQRIRHPRGAGEADVGHLVHPGSALGVERAVGADALEAVGL